MDAARQLLDELMGRNRNELPDERREVNRRFDDPDVCKYFLCGFCPHDLFTNTKSDLGPCNNIHDEELKEKWELCDKKHRYPYESDFYRFLERLISDLDRKIQRSLQRIQDQDTPDMLNEQNKLKLARINTETESLLRKIEDLGEQGEVEEASACMKRLDALKLEKSQLLRASEMYSVTAQEKKMRVCEVCGAFLIVNDTDKRTAGHVDGKLHTGYALIRVALDDYNKRMENERTKRRGADLEAADKESKKASPKKSRERSRERERERDRTRSGDRDRERDRDRRGGRRERERERSRERNFDHQDNPEGRERSKSRERRKSRHSDEGKLAMKGNEVISSF
uniref:Uncharacterized protein n=1 Tax=Arcella intermedia TaxID=1963864 RepID=A0A6B2L9L9_9EUKA|eukprot:TRINITY_DN186_c0_g1_i1.p1 TRINITY_DN186_c0_g1~~TRINITY_DN186_c0_g1_i1.p1  ORF type:complete len:340 (+),score=38.66 TRINITY_DN186_c0_g1_i1:42-1061(+)